MAKEKSIISTSSKKGVTIAKRNPWWDKIEAAQANQKDFFTQGKRLIKYYGAGYYKEYQDNFVALNNVYVNILFEFVKVMIPFLYARDPEVLVQPKQKGLREKAKFFRQVLQYIIQEIKLKRTEKRVLLDALLPGWGITRVGYSFETAETTINPDEFRGMTEDQQKMMILHPKNKQRENPESDPYVFATIKQDQAWAIRWPWDKFYVDPSGTSPTDLSDHKFVIFESIADEEDLKKETSMSAEYGLMKDKSGRALFEVWDRLSRKRLLFLDGCDEPINGDGDEWPKWVELFPVSVLAFNELPGKSLPVADGTIMESQIREKNHIRTQQVTHRKRFNRKYTIPEEGAAPEEILKWEANVDGSLVKLRKGAAISAVPDAPLPSDVYNVENRIDSDLARLSGTQEIDRGAANTVEQTATATSYKEQRLQLRTSERQDVVETHMTDVVTMISHIVKEHYDFPHVVEILGPDNQVQIDEYTKEQLDGEYDVDIHIGSMLPLNRPQMIKTAQDNFNLMFGKGFNNQELARNVLEAQDAQNIDEILTPPAPPPQTTMPGQENPALGGLASNGGTVNPAMMRAGPATEGAMASARGMAQ